MKGKYKSKESKLLKILYSSRNRKKEHGWSKDVGAGFTQADIKDIEPDLGGLFFKFTWGNQTIPVQELNLRETKETIKFLKKKGLKKVI